MRKQSRYVKYMSYEKKLDLIITHYTLFLSALTNLDLLGMDLKEYAITYSWASNILAKMRRYEEPSRYYGHEL